MNDKVYVLSSSTGNGESLFLSGPAQPRGIHGSLDEATPNLYYAKTFPTEKEAWEWREVWAAGHWQITPIDAKRMFKGKLSR